MKITCELCGGKDFLKKDELFVCEKCGTKYSLEDAKKLLSNDQYANNPINTSELLESDDKSFSKTSDIEDKCESDKKAQKSAKKRIIAFLVLVAIVIACYMLVPSESAVFGDKSNGTVIRDIAWGMSKDEILNIEAGKNDSSDPYISEKAIGRIIYSTENLEYYGESCEAVIYICQDYGIGSSGEFELLLSEIQLHFDESSFDKLKEAMTGELGESHFKTVYPFSQPFETIGWRTEKSIITLTFTNNLTSVCFEELK